MSGHERGPGGRSDMDGHALPSGEGGMDGLGRALRDAYNPPPPTPREAMWSAIEARLAPRQAGVTDLAEARARRVRRAWPGWSWAAAAAAVLVMGVGIGRMTAPGAGPVADAGKAGGAGTESGADPALLRLAAVEHLSRSETLLRMVRADGAAGRIDPAVGTWAEGLLQQTRLLLDAKGGQDPAMDALLEDLELVLVQIVGVAGAAGEDQARARSELSLALDGLERNDMLSRIQAVVPSGPGMAGI